MKPDRHPLLRDLLDDAATPAWAEATLARTLAAARAQRRRKIATRWAGALAVLLLSAILLRSEFFQSHDLAGGAGVIPATLSAQLPLITDDNAAMLASTPPKPVHFLTDEELLARFPDRSVALIGSGSRQQLVFLDIPSSRRPSNQ